MAIRCDTCRYLFSSEWKNKKSCPFCGSLLFHDNSPDQHLLDQGYTRASLPSLIPRPAPSSARDADPLDALRSSYYSEHSSGTAAPKDGSEAAPQTPDSAEDYFSHFSGTSAPTPPTVSAQEMPDFSRDFQPNPEPVPVATAESRSSEPAHQQDPLEQQRRQLERSYRRSAFRDTLTSLPWAVIFRVLLVLFVVFAVIAFIKALPLLLNSLLDFVLALAVNLLPPILLLYLFWCIIRNLFR